jgi:hypothetical protein
MSGCTLFRCSIVLLQEHIADGASSPKLLGKLVYCTLIGAVIFHQQKLPSSFPPTSWFCTFSSIQISYVLLPSQTIGS